MAVVMSSSHLQQLRGDAVVALVLAMATTAVAGADTANDETFPNGKGIHVPITYSDSTTLYNPQPGPVVRFVSRPASRLGFHSMVQTTNQAFDLPPFATIRLEAVHAKGSWFANGKRIRQRGLTVSVTFG